MLHDLPLHARFRPARYWWLFVGSFVVIALACVAYRGLPTRPFAADDFQWLIGARRLDFAAMLGQAFDSSQNHFYRPMVWLLFWLQARAFDLDPRGYHAVSFVLHLANAFLLGWLVFRLTNDHRRPTKERLLLVGRRWSFVLPTAFVALHPAAFEAVAWVSAQSELLAAFWLLLALHLWVSATNDTQRTVKEGKQHLSPFVVRLLSVLFLALALLTKESAVIGLPLLFLVDRAITINGQPTTSKFRFALPTLLTLAYLALQLRVERENYVVDQGGYGFGWQLVTNPLRSLALIVVPLPGSEHANAPWLVPVGAVIAMLLLLWLIAERRLQIALSKNNTIYNLRSVIPLAALALTLLPTAPFVSPPDSRYLYLPVMAFACVGAAIIGWLTHLDHRSSISVQHFALGVATLSFVLAIYAVQETAAREQRFAVATGSDGSLMTVATATCAARTPDRVILLNAPMAEQHARALLDLACGDTITPIFVDSMETAEANLEANSLIVDFPGGTAHIARQT